MSERHDADVDPDLDEALTDDWADVELDSGEEGEVVELDLGVFDHGDRRPPSTEVEVATLLAEGVLDLEGRLMAASNVTLIGAIRTDTLAGECVYKPVAGERPLWDFPDGTLAGREISAFLVSEAMGWRIVPPTLLRDGPFGPGMVQLWMNADPAVDLVQFVRRDVPELRRMAVFDAVVNNADRKGGHIIPMADGHVHGVDHGICFSPDPKLRTLLWRWAGKPLTVEALAVLERLADDLRGDLGEQLHEHLTRREVRRTEQRVADLLRTQLHPQPSGDWPALPWPPF
ncbi:MAG: Phosphatidylinositol 3-and 4-kinase [Modestobacter sp.]|nr:Phosphatidylinositol 3-and 4-kinase [Modestobacter sp.]